MTASQDVRRRASRTRSSEQGIVLEQYYAELGHGQQELSTTHAPALRAVDEQIFVRETIRGGRGAASAWSRRSHRSRGRKRPATEATSTSRSGMSRPAATASTTRRRTTGCSAEARSFIAGVLEHLPGLCGLTAPSFNSYHRILPQYWAGAFACWGHDNREAPVRVPSRLHRDGGGLDERGAEGLRRDLQPVPRGRRADRRGPRRPRARPRAARAGRGRSGDDRRGRAARRGRRAPPRDPARRARGASRRRRAHGRARRRR